jgi:hypothetical protein
VDRCSSLPQTLTTSALPRVLLTQDITPSVISSSNISRAWLASPLCSLLVLLLPCCKTIARRSNGRAQLQQVALLAPASAPSVLRRPLLQFAPVAITCLQLVHLHARSRRCSLDGLPCSHTVSATPLRHMASVAVLQFVHDPHDDPPVPGCVHLTLARVYAWDRACSLSLVKDHFITFGKDHTVIGYCCDDAELRRRQL